MNTACLRAKCALPPAACAWMHAHMHCTRTSARHAAAPYRTALHATPRHGMRIARDRAARRAMAPCTAYQVHHSVPCAALHHTTYRTAIHRATTHRHALCHTAPQRHIRIAHERVQTCGQRVCGRVYGHACRHVRRRVCGAGGPRTTSTCSGMSGWTTGSSRRFCGRGSPSPTLSPPGFLHAATRFSRQWSRSMSPSATSYTSLRPT